MAGELSIVTWNVNSLRARLGRVTAWLERHAPDVVCLQETKCDEASFPRAELERAGYRAVCAGQSNGLNGVAILAREPLEDPVASLGGHADDPQQRFISARVAGVRVLCVYVPNGQAVGSDAYFYKLDWLSRLAAYLRARHSPDEPLVLLGDFNIAPEDRDVQEPQAWAGGIHCSPHERRALGYLEQWGLQDALRVVTSAGGIYTWFSYQDTYKSFRAEDGLRIDLIYVTAPLARRLVAVEVDLEERAGERPSDHAPVTARLGGEGAVRRSRGGSGGSSAAG